MGALEEQNKMTLELHMLVDVDGGDNDGPEADAIRDRMEGNWRLLTAEERETAGVYSASLTGVK